MKRRSAATACALTIGAGVMALVACQRPTQSAARPIRVVVLPYLTFAPMFIARDEGYFAQEGLAPEFVPLQTSAEAIPALAQGRVDVVGGSISVGFLNVVARGARIRAVADKGYVDASGCAAQAILTRPALASADALASAARTRRLSIAVNQSSYNLYYTELALAAAGIHPDEVTVLDVPDALLADALGRGTVDLATTVEPWITRIVEARSGLLWRRAGEVIPDFQQSFVFYGPTLLDEDPPAGLAFMRAYLRGVRQYSQGKTARNLDILTARTGQDRGLIERSCWPPFRSDGGVNLKSVLAFQRWGLDRGLLDRQLAASAFWEPRFIAAARTALGATGR
jgi:NitT/TauT family transport system substrate-binding protein